MFKLHIAVTLASIDALKVDLTKNLPDVKSSHRVEALARGLGFQTYAGMRAACSSPPITRSADGAAFASYLSGHGFEVDSRSFYLAVARGVLAGILNQDPALTMHGIGVGPRERRGGQWESWAQLAKRHEYSRAEFTHESSVEEFLRSLVYVSRIAPTKTNNNRTNSYSLKHVAERLHCTYPEGQPLGPAYVSNGALIAATVHAGFRYRTQPDPYGGLSLNVSFNMSRRSIWALAEAVRAEESRQVDRRAA